MQAEPDALDLRGLLVVGKQETDFGEAPMFKGSNNWGAIHCGRPPCDPDRSFQGRDTLRGKSIQACFCKYPTLFDGAVHFVRELYKRRPSVRAAVRTRDWRRVAMAMERTKYFVGEHLVEPRVEQFERIDREASGNLNEEPFPTSSRPSPATDEARDDVGNGSGLALLLLLWLFSESR